MTILAGGANAHGHRRDQDANPKQLVMTLDHDVQNKTDKNLKRY
jgi:hypothetical protein